MAINDNLVKIYEKLFQDRNPSLFDRYPGYYRAKIVETNDPLNMYRIKFKCPELHNFDLSSEDCPWACPSFEHGGKGTGNWTSPAIDDIVWITFEKNHPYGPIWTGHAEPTRRRYYKLHAIFQKSQQYVDEYGKSLGADKINWIDDYTSKDGRPYSNGTKDRYGNIFVMDSTGFFPKEHDLAPALSGNDPLSNSAFEQSSIKPIMNKPDRKMIAYVTKYGHMCIMGDQGFNWKNFFSGDFDKDHEIEKEREFNLIKLLNEDTPNSVDRDQRRLEFKTPYGHKFEMRDVGWNKTRANDLFSKSAVVSDFSERDERWIKLRSKAGHLLEFMDMGSDSENDTFVKRINIEEVGGKVDSEDSDWQKRDARQMRLVTRYGFKFVLDDRGSDKIDAESKEIPRGNGWLIKGRRDNKGFGWEVNEKDELNRSLMYTPKSKIFELNDKFGYAMICTDTNKPISKDWKKLKENEFATSIAMTFSPQKDTYHMKLDLSNNFLRLKTPATGGNEQGFEARNAGGPNFVWVEMVDRDNRALILNSTLKFAAFHDRSEQKYIVLDDNNDTILIHNKLGDIQIISNKNISVKSTGSIAFEAGTDFTVKCMNFVVDSAGTNFVVDAVGFGGNKPLFAPKSFAQHIGCKPGPKAGPPTPKMGATIPVIDYAPPPLTPNDRGTVYNSPFTEVAENIIKGS